MILVFGFFFVCFSKGLVDNENNGNDGNMDDENEINDKNNDNSDQSNDELWEIELESENHKIENWVHGNKQFVCLFLFFFWCVCFFDVWCLIFAKKNQKNRCNR